MSELEELRQRVDVLEGDVRHVMVENEVTRRMAVHADRDLSELQQQRRADVQLFQALRKTQVEHGEVLKEHSQVLGVLVTGQARHEQILDMHSTKLDHLTTAVDSIVKHLGITPAEKSVPSQSSAEG